MERCQTCLRLCCTLLLGATLSIWVSDAAQTTPVPGDGSSNSANGEAMLYNPSAARSTLISPGHTSPSDVIADVTRSCFSWAEWETVALMCGAALVSALLISTVFLSCQVYQLKRRARAGRAPRTNVDLVSGMGYPTSSRGGSREVVGGGTSESSVRMEEVKQVGEEETAGMGGEHGAIKKEGDTGKEVATQQSSAQAGSQSEASPTKPAKKEVEVLVVV